MNPSNSPARQALLAEDHTYSPHPVDATWVSQPLNQERGEYENPPDSRSIPALRPRAISQQGRGRLRRPTFHLRAVCRALRRDWRELLIAAGAQPAIGSPSSAPTVIVCWKRITECSKPAAFCCRSTSAWARRNSHSFWMMRRPVSFSSNPFLASGRVTSGFCPVDRGVHPLGWPAADQLAEDHATTTTCWKRLVLASATSRKSMKILLPSFFTPAAAVIVPRA